ncbi:MAG: DinB family protein [Candidatus Acidiferrales bacterium]
MAMNQALLVEFDQEMAKTRNTLERVPDDKFDWKPHPKSGTMGWLGNHIANMTGWAADTLTSESFDFSPGGKQIQMPSAKNRKELLANFDKGAAVTRTALAKASDQDMMKTWTLLQNGTVIFAMPRAAVLRGMILNHIIHHRAQLCVYYRLNDIPVPALYGPSADEATMTATAG